MPHREGGWVEAFSPQTRLSPHWQAPSSDSGWWPLVPTLPSAARCSKEAGVHALGQGGHRWVDSNPAG